MNKAEENKVTMWVKEQKQKCTEWWERGDDADDAERAADKNTSDISLDGDGSDGGGVLCLTFSFIGVCLSVCVFMQPGGLDA